MINSKIKNIFLSSWDLYLNNMLYIVGSYALVAIISMICNSIINQPGNALSIQNLIFYFSSELFVLGLSLGLLKIFLLLNQNQHATIQTLFSSFDLVFRTFNASILFSLIMFLVILPGVFIILMACDINSFLNVFFNLLDFKSLSIMNFDLLEISNIMIHNQVLFIFGIIITIINIIWAILRFQFYQYLIVDKKCGSIHSLKISYDITNGKTAILIQFAFFILIINLIGALFFGIGLLITIPFSLLSMSKLYLSIQKGIV